MSQYDQYLDDDDDEEEFEDEDGEILSEQDRDAILFNELIIKQIVRELVILDNRDILEFLEYEFDKLGFTDGTDLVLVGIEFDKQYILQFYNVREDKTVKTGTGAGNMHMLIDGWVLKTLCDLYFENLLGSMSDIYPSDSTDAYMNILIDVLDWKKENEIEELPSKSPEDGPREDK